MQKKKLIYYYVGKKIEKLIYSIDKHKKMWYYLWVDLSFVESLTESRSLGLKASIKRVVGRATLRSR